MPENSSAPPIRILFARRLKQMRIPRGFATARSFANALAIDENRYTRYERAEVEPDLSLIAKICRVLNVSPNDLLDFAPQPQPASGLAEAAPPAPAGDGVHGAVSPRRALAWQLADELARLDAGQATHAFDRLARVSKIFNEIDADAFNFVAQMTATPRFSTIDGATVVRIGELAEQLVSAVNAEILGSAPRS